LDDALYRITSQWTIEQTKLAGKREQLLILLREVGTVRFKHAIQRAIETHHGDFCPPIGFFRNCVVSRVTMSDDDRGFWRDPNCARCHGSGWFYVRDYEADNLYKRDGHQAVLRCREPECLHVGESRKQPQSQPVIVAKGRQVS
jgi:hypothetical protein